MPPDKVFGRIEKDFRKIENINTPHEYYKIWAQEWKTYNYKEEVRKC